MSTEEIATRLRGVVGLPPDERAPGEGAAWRGAPRPSVVERVDVGGWLAWCLVGLVVFADGFPTWERLRRESRRLVLALAMLRARGNISEAARRLEMTRKVLRDNLRAVGLYPWKVRRFEDAGVIEDGRLGVVQHKAEMPDGGGPAWLVRDGRSEPLFGGRWIPVDRARAYAREYGHGFEAG